MITNQSEKKYKILFVCLGNICRSPMAQAVFSDLVKSNGLSSHFPRIESAGTTDLHVGEPPDERTVAVCKKNRISINSFAQHLKKQDFYDYDYILGMDRQNLKNIQSLIPSDSKAKVQLFGEFSDGRIIDDPYYSHDKVSRSSVFLSFDIPKTFFISFD
ncbi:phosphotyrosine protein phosphatase I superfamily [Melampsora americana]|nr:phosphotyrosine protein phosphatase I superfamily [Melampsora americana]